MLASRRSVLRACGGAVGTGTLAGVAGCSGLLGEDDGSGNGTASVDDGSGDGTPSPDDEGTTSGDDTGSEPPWYANWLPAPGELGHTHYHFTYAAVSDLLSIVDVSGIERPPEDVLGVDRALIDRVVVAADDADSGPAVAVFQGSFESATVVEEETQVRDFSEQDTRAGYTLWGADGGSPYALGAKDGRVVQGFSPSGDPLSTVRTAIDTRHGDLKRYVDADEAVGSLVSTLGEGAAVTAHRHEPRDDLGGALGEGSTLTIGDGECTLSASAVFGSEGGVASDPVAEWAASKWPFDGAEDVEVATDGPVATVETTMPTGDVEDADIDLGSGPGAGGTSNPAPNVQFFFGYDNDPGGPGTGILTITHEGGDAVVADELTLSGNGFADVEGADQTNPVAWAGSTSGEVAGQSAVVAGDSVDVGVRSDYAVALVWVGEQESAELAVDRGPDA